MVKTKQNPVGYFGRYTRIPVKKGSISSPGCWKVNPQQYAGIHIFSYRSPSKADKQAIVRDKIMSGFSLKTGNFAFS